MNSSSPKADVRAQSSSLHHVMITIDALIEKHFPVAKAPKWVNYDQFKAEKREMIRRNFLDARKDGDTEYVEHELMFAYESEWFDTGSSGVCDAIDEDCVIISKASLCTPISPPMGQASLRAHSRPRKVFLNITLVEVQSKGRLRRLRFAQ